MAFVILLFRDRYHNNLQPFSSRLGQTKYVCFFLVLCVFCLQKCSFFAAVWCLNLFFFQQQLVFKKKRLPTARNQLSRFQIQSRIRKTTTTTQSPLTHTHTSTTGKSDRRRRRSDFLLGVSSQHSHKQTFKNNHLPPVETFFHSSSFPFSFLLFGTGFFLNFSTNLTQIHDHF